MAKFTRLSLAVPFALIMGSIGASAQTITLATPVSWDFGGTTFNADRVCTGTLAMDSCGRFFTSQFMPWISSSGAADAGKHAPYGGTANGTPLAGWPAYGAINPSQRGVYFAYDPVFAAGVLTSVSGWSSWAGSTPPGANGNFTNFSNLTATREWAMVPEINGSGFAYIAFILGALGLWLYSGAGRGRQEETPVAA